MTHMCDDIEHNLDANETMSDENSVKTNGVASFDYHLAVLVCLSRLFNQKTCYKLLCR
jgi:hypothetical protein